MQQVQVYEERIFDARARFTPGAPASRYQVGWLDALNYVLVGELPDGEDAPTEINEADHFQLIVKCLERLEEHYAAKMKWTDAGRMKGLRISVQKMTDSMGIILDD